MRIELLRIGPAVRRLPDARHGESLAPGRAGTVAVGLARCSGTRDSG